MEAGDGSRTPARHHSDAWNIRVIYLLLLSPSSPSRSLVRNLRTRHHAHYLGRNTADRDPMRSSTIASPREGAAASPRQQQRPLIDLHLRASAFAAGLKHGISDGFKPNNTNVEWLFEEADAIEAQPRRADPHLLRNTQMPRSEEFTGDDTAALLPLLGLNSDSVFAEVSE